MDQTSPTIEKVHVTRTPGVCGGKPCVAGHRIRVQDVYVLHERRGLSADEIVAEYPQLTHADVYAALAYFWDHRDEILGDMKTADARVEEMKARYPSKLAAKLKELDGPQAAP